MARKVSPGEYIGLGVSFGVTMAVSILITTKVGSWIDEKLGTGSVFTFIGLLAGIFSGFRVLLANIESMERPRGRELDALEEENKIKKSN